MPNPRAVVLLLFNLVVALAFNVTDKNCRGFETAVGTKVECIYRRGKDVLRLEPNYANMVITVISPSGGASLSPNNTPYDHSRGKGSKIVLKVANNLPQAGLFTILSYVNGENASNISSGRNPAQLPRPAGKGGNCPAETTNRYAGSGGERTRVLFYADSANLKVRPASILIVGGGGGAGAVLNGGISRGGDAALLDRYNNLGIRVSEGKVASQKIMQTANWIVTPGKAGYPPDSGAQGGSIHDRESSNSHGGSGGRGQATGLAYAAQGDGLPGFVRTRSDGRDAYQNLGHGGSLVRSEGLTYCLAGGGGGDGFYRGGGGGAHAIYGHPNTSVAAGGGGGGSSELDDVELQMYEIVHQENVYDPNPRVIFTFDIPAPHMASASASSASTKKVK